MPYAGIPQLNQVFGTSNIIELKFEDITGTEYQTTNGTGVGTDKLLAVWKVTGFDTVKNTVHAYAMNMEAEQKIDVALANSVLEWIVSSDGGVTWFQIANMVINSQVYIQSNFTTNPNFLSAGASPITEFRIALGLRNSTSATNVRAKNISARTWITLPTGFIVTRLV